MSRTNRDHAKKKHRPLVDDEAIAQQLEDLLTPAITSQEHYYRSLGLRDRILNLPLGELTPWLGADRAILGKETGLGDRKTSEAA